MSDAVDMLEKERIQEMMTMRKHVVETKRQIDKTIAKGTAQQGPLVGLYQKEVKGFVMSVETVLDPVNGETSEYWNNATIGDFSLPNGTVQRVVGLSEFLQLPVTFEIEVDTVKKRSYRHAEERVTETRRVRPPREIAEQAFRLTNRALDERGFDLSELTEDQDTAKFSKIDDVKKATEVYDFLNELDDSSLREVQLVIQEELLDGANTNGHQNHEQS
jgi:hypothetical protein